MDVIARQQSVRPISLLIVFSVLSACATTANEPAVPDSSDASTSDPWESANRAVYAFNDGLDTASRQTTTTNFSTTTRNNST